MRSISRAALGLLGLLLLAVTPVQGQTIFTVTTTADSGAGSLRQAILDANATSNGGQPDEIHFTIDAQNDPGCNSTTGVCTIAVQSELPEITEALLVDGVTQAGADCGVDIPLRTLKIVLDGSAAGPVADGLRIATSNSTVRGLVINQFGEIFGAGSGIVITGLGSTGNVVECNFLGTDATGTLARGNIFFGVHLLSKTAANRIGGTGPGMGNLIADNGMRITDSNNNVVQGNYIGIDVTGTASLGTSGNGIRLESGSQNNILGGTTSAARNIIAGQGADGIEIHGGGTNGNRVEGNFIGTDITGMVAIPNSHFGVAVLAGAQNNTIGGPTGGAGNLISGNIRGGVHIQDATTMGNLVQGNLIGTDISGTTPLGNQVDGVSLFLNTNNNTIGGMAPGSGNIIAFHVSRGVSLDLAGTGNVILSNSIFANSAIGIDLGRNGLTPNDSGDSDTGPNNFQNFPAIADAFLAQGNLYLLYRIDSDPSNAAYPLVVEVFEADLDDEEGQTFLARDTYTTTDFNSGVDKLLNLGPIGGIAPGDKLVATATDDEGNTSEFSFGATEVGTASFAIRLKRVFVTNSGKGKVVIKWQSADVSTNKVGIYVDDAFQTNTANDNKAKVKFNNPNDGPFALRLCEKNQPTICSNTVVADFAGAPVVGPDDPDFYDDENDGYADKVSDGLPEALALAGSYPNPFNPVATIRYALPEAAHVALRVYDVLGREVAVLVDDLQAAGRHEAVFEASYLPSGVYVYRLEIQGQVKTGQMLLVK